MTAIVTAACCGIRTELEDSAAGPRPIGGCPQSAYFDSDVFCPPASHQITVVSENESPVGIDKLMQHIGQRFRVAYLEGIREPVTQAWTGDLRVCVRRRLHACGRCGRSSVLWMHAHHHSSIYNRLSKLGSTSQHSKCTAT